jgi:hypothetical protein
VVPCAGTAVLAGDAIEDHECREVRHITTSKTGSDERVAHQLRIELRLSITRVKKPDEVSEPMDEHPPFLKMGK